MSLGADPTHAPRPGFPGSWRLLFPFLRPHGWSLFASGLAIMATSGATLAAVPVARMAAEVFSNPTLSRLNALVVALVMVYGAKSLFTWVASLSAAHVALSTIAAVRVALFRHVQALDLAFFERRASGDLTARLVSDVNLLKDALVVLSSELAPSVVIVVVALGYLFVLNWHLAALAVLGMPLVGVAIDRFAQRIRAWSTTAQHRVGDLTGYLAERLANVALVKSFGREDYEASHFERFNDAHFHAGFRGAQAQAMQTPVVGFLQILAIAAVLWLGGWEILHHRLAVADLLAFAAAVGVCIDPILVVSNALGKIQLASGALERISEVFAAQPELVEAPVPFRPAGVQGEVCFEGVEFSYSGGLEVIRGLDLVIPAGSMVAVIGPSGAGKSTLVKLLQRFYDPTKGRVTLDGHDLRELDLAWLRAQIGYVSQDSALFSGSVTETLRYGRLEATQAELEAAARAANAHEFILALPQGYDTEVGERGAMLSGGQRQRLAIARALLRDPKLLLLDEATSALDADSEALVQQALEHLVKGRTTVVVAHRLSTIQRADRIVTLADGRLVDVGTHQELLERGGLYAQWLEAQNQRA